MRRMGGIADKNDVFVMPFLAQHASKLEPYRRTLQMLGVRSQSVAVQALGKELFAQRDRFRFVHLVDAGLDPVFFRRFHNERGPVIVEAICVEVKPTPLCGFEIKGESVQLLFRAKPDEAIVAYLNVRLKYALVFLACHRRSAVGCDHKIVVGGVHVWIGDFFLKHQPHAEAGGTLLEYLKKFHSGNAAKSMSARRQLAIFEINVNVVPVAEGLRNSGVALRIGLPESVHGFIGKHDAPSESTVGLVALDYGDVPRRIGLLRENREIKSSGTAAQANNFHRFLPSALSICGTLRSSVMLLRVFAILPAIFRRCPRRGPLPEAFSNIRLRPSVREASEGPPSARRSFCVHEPASRHSP